MLNLLPTFVCLIRISLFFLLNTQCKLPYFDCNIIKKLELLNKKKKSNIIHNLFLRKKKQNTVKPKKDYIFRNLLCEREYCVNWNIRGI